MNLLEKIKNARWSAGQGAERYINLAGGGVLVLIFAAVALNLIFDPMSGNRRWLAKELEPIPDSIELRDAQEVQSHAWRKAIDEHSNLWESLIPPPPPPTPPPPPPPTPPDPRTIFEGIKATRAQIGAKVKIVSPDNAKGEFLAVGDTIKGWTIKEISKKQVIVEVFWKEGNKPVVYGIPRE